MQKFDWVQFHRNIHNRRGSTPQLAEIVKRDNAVVYSLFFRILHPRGESCPLDLDSKITYAYAAATVLKTEHPELEIRVVGEELVSVGGLFRVNLTPCEFIKQNDKGKLEYLSIEDARGNLQKASEKVLNHSGEIVTKYTPKTEGELNRIQKYLMAVEKQHGRKPRKGQRIFYYH